tara:strand:- start:377 stop:592 length:216 start_codon:yes stop_codon:yes gene_type:complete
MKHKVIDNPELVRDNNNKAILNTDDDSLMSYKNKRNNDRKLLKMYEEHQELKQDIIDIKNLLMKIVLENKI